MIFPSNFWSSTDDVVKIFQLIESSWMKLSNEGLWRVDNERFVNS